jgi:hypothetical protein
VDTGGGVRDEELEGALIVCKLAAQIEELVVAQGLSDGEAANLCAIY